MAILSGLTISGGGITIVGGSTPAANDPYFMYNTLLLPGTSTTFVDDASTNNFALSIFGDTTPNGSNPYTPGYYSNYFDGASYLTVPAGTAFAPGTGDFTVEGWINPSGLMSGYGMIYGQSYSGANYFTIFATDGSIKFININATYSSGANLWTVGSWNHFAVVRSSGSTRVYLNGLGGTAAADAYNYNEVTVLPTIGRYSHTGSNFYYGYISNLRYVKGTAVYTANFTPPTTPLTAIANTSLLTCQSNRFIDNSTNNFTVTVAGNTTVNSFQPFTPNSSYSTYGSGYFDGTGDYIVTPASSALALAANAADFTMECWVYNKGGAGSQYGRGICIYYPLGGYATNRLMFRLVPGENRINVYLLANSSAEFGGGGTDGTAIVTLNAWTHVALVRNAGVFYVYVNGVLDITVNSSSAASSIPFTTFNTIEVGRTQDGTSPDWFGNISNYRFVKGTAVYTSAFTPPSVPLTAITNTNLLTLQNNQSINNNLFLDNSTNNYFVTRYGNTMQGTFSPYGGNWSNYFDGTGDYLTVPGNSVFAFGTGDFTLEVWLYANSISTGTFDRICATSDYTGSGFDWTLNSGASNIFLAGTAYPIGSITTNVWHHLVYTRSGSVIRGFLNGNLSSYTTGATQNISSTAQLNIGVGYSGTYLNGYLSNLRIIKGSIPAAYQTSSTTTGTQIFTSPTSPVTAIAGTSLLTCQSNRIVDTSINNFTVTKAGDTSVQRFSPFSPSSLTPTSYSAYLDGTGDYLTAPSNSALAFPADFTIECWVYPLAWATNAPICSGSEGAVQLSKYGSNENLGVAIQGLAWHITDAALPTLNTWSHVALTRSGSTLKIFINGVQSGSTGSTAYSFTTTNLIGGDGTSYVQGYMTNYRVVKGTAVYTGNFTPPTAPLTAISGTSLLTLQSPTFIDNSTNNFAITAFGNSQPTIQNPFGYTTATTNGYTSNTIGGSGYFDGGGDYLVPSATANTAMQAIANSLITIEFWVYTTAIQAITAYYTSVFGQFLAAAINGRYAISLAGSSTVSPQQASFAWTTSGSTSESVTSSITLNQLSWNHVAITIDSTTPASSIITIYSNGVGQIFTGKDLSSQTVDNGSPFYIGADYGSTLQPVTGYLSDFRFVRGQLVYKSNFVPPSQPLTAVTNTTLLLNMTNSGILDNSMMNNLETVGNAQISTTQSKFGGSSMYFDGTGDYLLMLPSIALAFPGDYTLECWVYLNSVSGNQGVYSSIDNSIDSNQGIAISFSGTSFLATSYISGGDVITHQTAVTTGQWYHLAMVRSGSTTKSYLNGVQSTGTTTSTYSLTQSGSTIGSAYPGTNPLNGYINDLRITKGYARYTATFTPPTTAFSVY